ncbi:hypothetical protein WJX72_010091 [[Myrmecia] bisecta]|uniref:Squalene monooxygenase n=1 Tax=[Myrmecia] bisecta TaxID=41462 RepID=A0AAW1R9D8_9CHLO
MGRGGESTSYPAEQEVGDIPAVPSQADYGRDPQDAWDLVVVGAGVAGSALAYSQGQAGRRVLLLERDLRQPHRIVGELLQPGGYLMLKKLGLAGCTEGIDAQKVYGYCMYKNGKEAKVHYPTEGFTGDIAGRSFHNGRFVQRLRQAAAGVSNVTVRQAKALHLINDQGSAWQEGQVVGGVQYQPLAYEGSAIMSTEGGPARTARANLTIVCDGMNSSLRGKLSTPEIEYPSYFVGLLLRGGSLPYANFGHVVLADPSPILFYPISSTEVRCLVDVPGTSLPSGLHNYLREHVAPQVPPQLRAAFVAAVEAKRVKSMPNKLMPAKPLHQPGALLLGDAFNMRHPLTGGGMTVALSDTNLLQEMLQPLPNFADPIATSNATAAFYTRRKPVSATINTLANALYKVFCWSDNEAHESMRQACFDYLRLGGIYSAGPISLLSGLNPRPSVLVMHFFMVAVYGVGRLLLPVPKLRDVRMAVMLLWCACCIIFPIIRAEGFRAVFLPFLVRKPRAEQKLRHAASFHADATAQIQARVGSSKVDKEA